MRCVAIFGFGFVVGLVVHARVVVGVWVVAGYVRHVVRRHALLVRHALGVQGHVPHVLRLLLDVQLVPRNPFVFVHVLVLVLVGALHALVWVRFHLLVHGLRAVVVALGCAGLRSRVQLVYEDKRVVLLRDKGFG